MENGAFRWKTAEREFDLGRPIIMGILNVTPDSFSDGGQFIEQDKALRHAEQLISDGADILDIGGESTRPGSARVAIDEEIRRTSPIISEIRKRFDVAISIDTSKTLVAKCAIDSGAEIINDISGFRFDPLLAGVAAKTGAGVILMHLRGEFGSMHKQEPVIEIIEEISSGFKASISIAGEAGIDSGYICLDPGIGFSKTFEQNLEILAKLGQLVTEFSPFPILIGTSRKSFIGKLLNDAAPDERLAATIASNVVAVNAGAKVIRVHDVKAHRDALEIVVAIKEAGLG